MKLAHAGPRDVAKAALDIHDTELRQGNPAPPRRRGAEHQGRVARVELVVPRFTSRGPYRDPVDYGRPLRVSAPVRDNVATLRVQGRATADLFTVAVIERAVEAASCGASRRVPDGRSAKVTLRRC